MVFDIFEDLLIQAKRNTHEEKYLLALYKLFVLLDLAVRYDYKHLTDTHYLRWLEESGCQAKDLDLPKSILKIRHHFLQGDAFGDADYLPLLSLRKEPAIFTAVLQGQERSFIHLNFICQRLLMILTTWFEQNKDVKAHPFFTLKQGLIYGNQQILFTDKK